MQFLKTAHVSVGNAAAEYLRSLRRHTYVTPTTYLEALSTFCATYTRKREELTSMRTRLTSGLTKLQAAFGQVGKLQVCVRLCAAPCAIFVAGMVACVCVGRASWRRWSPDLWPHKRAWRR